MHTIRSKARHTAWRQDGGNFNPFSRTRSRPDHPPHEDPENGLQTQHENHSEACIEDTMEAGRAKSSGTNDEFAAARHNTFSASPTTTTETAVTRTELEKAAQESHADATNGTGAPEAQGIKQRKSQRNQDEMTGPDEQVEDEPEAKRKMARKIPVGDQIRALLLGSWINILLVAVPVGFALNYAHLNGVAIFVVNFIAIIPLAAMLSYATEEIALRTGEVLGGLLNASFGNAVELIVSIQALVQGKILIVKTSLIGSMLSNLLLVMGMSFFLGGVNRMEQYFNVTVAQTAASLLALAIGSLIVPTVFLFWTPGDTNQNDLEDKVEALSRGTSIILLVVYACYLIFQLKSHRAMYNAPSQKVEKRKSLSFGTDALVKGGANFAASAGGGVNQKNLNSLKDQEEDEEEEEAQLSLIGAFVALGLSTTLVALCSEFMVSAIDDITGPGSPVSQTFVGLILLPIVGNAAEHATAVTVAMKDKMDLSIGVAVGSSMQVALLVLPFIDVLGWITGSQDCHGNQMSLSFDGFQLAVLFVAVLLVNYLIQDGKSHWLEGVLLMASYIIIAVAAWFYPTTQDCTTAAG